MARQEGLTLANIHAAHMEVLVKLCGCGSTLDPRLDGGDRKILNGREVNDDCYFEDLGEHIDKNPIFLPRLPRGGTA